MNINESLFIIDEPLVISCLGNKGVITILGFSTCICLQSFKVMITESAFQSPVPVMLEKFHIHIFHRELCSQTRHIHVLGLDENMVPNVPYRMQVLHGQEINSMSSNIYNKLILYQIKLAP